MLHRVGTSGDFSIQIGNHVYRLVDLFAKTVFAAKPLNVYSTVAGTKIVTKLKANDPIGTIRGYYPQGRGSAKKNYLLVGPSSVDFKAIEYAPDNFIESRLIEQGIKNAQENAAIDDQLKSDENTPWYIKLGKTFLPWAAVAAVGIALINKKKS